MKDLLLLVISLPFKLLQLIGLFLYTIVTLVTLPGLIIANLLRWYLCRLMEIPIFRFELLHKGWPPSMLQYAPPATLRQAVGLVFEPWLMLTVPAFVLLLVARILQLNGPEWVALLVAWLGASIAAYALPSRAEINKIWQLSKSAVARRNWLAVLGFPLVVLLYVVVLLESMMPVPRLLWPLAVWIAAFELGGKLVL